MKRHSPVLLLIGPLLASCDRPAIDPSHSLVGARELPNSRELSRETIQINRSFGVGYGHVVNSHLLSYELRPDNSLSVTHYENGVEKGQVERGSETFELPRDVANNARRAMWRMRPSPLKGVEYDIRPAGCPFRLHDSSEYALLFIKEGGETGTRNDLLGFSVVPPPESCNNSTARSARALVRQVLADFPKSKVAASFQRLESKN